MTWIYIHMGRCTRKSNARSRESRRRLKTRRKGGGLPNWAGRPNTGSTASYVKGKGCPATYSAKSAARAELSLRPYVASGGRRRTARKGGKARQTARSGGAASAKRGRGGDEEVDPSPPPKPNNRNAAVAPPMAQLCAGSAGGYDLSHWCSTGELKPGAKRPKIRGGRANVVGSNVPWALTYETPGPLPKGMSALATPPPYVVTNHCQRNKFTRGR